MVLPLLSLRSGSTDVALQGVTRQGGQPGPEEDVFTARRRVDRELVVATDGAARLTTMASELRSGGAVARKWQESVRVSMSYKQDLYARELAGMQIEIDDSQAKVAQFVRQARSGEDALADGQTSTWDIAEKVSGRWQSLVLKAASLDRMILQARRRKDEINNASDLPRLRAEMASALESITTDFASQAILLEAIADICKAFLRNPLVINNTFLNFIFLGNAGAGKTRLATSVAFVLGKLGIFIYDQLVVCGRSDLIAEYEGQTATKTRNFLNANLEKVIFLDEAYSLTTWQNKGDDGPRVLSAYSGEATTELVAFLSQRIGSVCFMAAGYEEQMLNDFIPSNEGIRRRFPFCVWLSDYTAEQLIEIYLDSLASSDPSRRQPLTRNETRMFFTTPALSYLIDVITGARERTANGLTHPLIAQLFQAQAGAMVTLASTTALLIASSKRPSAIGVSSTGLETWAIGATDMHDILRTVLSQQLGPQATEAVRELEAIATDNGWLNAGSWQVPAAMTPRARGRKGAR
jgi:DNA replication protein DnaC